MAWVLYMLTFTKSLDLPCYFMLALQYKYLLGLAILEEDAIEADLADCTGFNSGHF